VDKVGGEHGSTLGQSLKVGPAREQSPLNIEKHVLAVIQDDFGVLPELMMDAIDSRAAPASKSLR
jgi:hypothetical protein